MLNTETKECTGCALCSSICPRNAIYMAPGHCGYYYPVVEKEMCINCGECNRYCPATHICNKELHEIICYSAYCSNEKKLIERTSGGVATELVEYYITNQNVVYGVEYTEDYKSARHIRIENFDNIKNISGTKYVQASMENVYDAIREDLKDNRNILFIGLPCEVAAVRSLFPNARENLFLCELVCHGPASPKTLKQYVEYIEDLYKSKIVKLNVRDKSAGWRMPYLRADFENGQSLLKQFYYTEYGEAFYLQGRESCYACKFKGNNSKADITLGDYWGISDTDIMFNKNGVSICICHSKQAASLLTKLTSLKIKEIKYDDAIKNNEDIICSRQIHDGTRKFSLIYEKKGLIASLFLRKNLKEKIKMIVRFVREKYGYYKKGN